MAEVLTHTPVLSNGGVSVCCSGNSTQEKSPLRSEAECQVCENDPQLLA